MDKQYPKVVVGGFIRNEKGEILLVKSYKWPGKWVVMGGHVEWGERYEEALVREVKEEVGLAVIFDRVIEVAQFVLDPDFHAQKHFIALQCECHVLGDDAPKIDHEEIQEVKWFSLEDAVNLPNIIDIARKTLQILANNM